MSISLRWLVIAGLIILPGISHAAIENIPEESGWEGRFIVGAGYTDIESNTVAGNKLIEVGSKTADSLTASPKSDDTAHAFFTGEIRYTFGDQWQAFLGSSLFDRLTLDFAQQLGLRKQTDGGQKFSAGILFSGIPTEVWEDPYQTTDTGPRNETDRDSMGIRLEWDKILSSGANLTLDFRDNDIDKDFIGQNITDLNVNACDADCQSSLLRDGDFVQLQAAWAFRPSQKHLLRPAVRWFDFDADGNAQDRSGYSVLLTWTYLAENYTFIANGAYSDTDYDNPNPIYDMDEDSDGFAVAGTLFYKISRDGRWQATATAAYGEKDSDIDFHDTKLFQVLLGAQFSFGNQKTKWLKH
jgi:hypothetical protein